MSGNLFILLKGIAIIVVTSYLFYDSLFISIFLSPYLYFYIKGEIDRERKKEQVQRLEEFKDGIVAVSFSLAVGYSVENAFKEALLELKNVYGEQSYTVQEFSQIVRKCNNNRNLEDLLIEYANRVQIDDVYYFAEVFRYAKRSGGNLILIIKNTAETIREKVDVKRQVNLIMYGRQKEQQVMSIVPYAIILYLRVTSKDLTDSLYGNPVGITIMSVGLVILIISGYISKRIVNIEI